MIDINDINYEDLFNDLYAFKIKRKGRLTYDATLSRILDYLMLEYDQPITDAAHQSHQVIEVVMDLDEGLINCEGWSK